MASVVLLRLHEIELKLKNNEPQSALRAVKNLIEGIEAQAKRDALEPFFSLEQLTSEMADCYNRGVERQSKKSFGKYIKEFRQKYKSNSMRVGK